MTLPVPSQAGHSSPSTRPEPLHSGQRAGAAASASGGGSSPGAMSGAGGRGGGGGGGGLVAGCRVGRGGGMGGGGVIAHSPPRMISRTTVSSADTSSEPKEPSRFEKNRNTRARYPPSFAVNRRSGR